MPQKRGRRRTAFLQHLEPRLLMARVEVVHEPDTSTASAFPTTGYWISASGNQAYFSPAGSDVELWTSDGTGAGTRPFRDVAAGGTAGNVVAVGGVTLWRETPASGANAVTWRTDGTDAGTYPLTAGTANPWELSATTDGRAGNLLYAVARHRQTGEYALAVTDGTTEGTRALVAGLAASPTFIRVVGGTVYFDAADAQAGRELWRTDGTAAGTYRVADIRPGATGSDPADAVASGDQLFFTADDGGGQGREWWVARPDAAPRRIADLASGVQRVGSRIAAPLAPASPGGLGVLVFYTRGWAPNSLSSQGLWRTDGTAAGTYRILATPTGQDVTRLLSARGRAYFVLNNTAYVTDGSAGGTTTVHTTAGYAPVPASGWGVLGNRLVFGGSTAAQGTELWISDGTPAGTVVLKDIAAGAASSNPWLFASDPAGGGTRLYFAADANDGKGMELWVTDGGAGGTYRVADVNKTTPSSLPWTLTRVGNEAFYYVQQNGPYRGLWKTDGTGAGTSKVSDVYLQVEPGYVQQTAALGGRLFFSGVASGTTTGFELFVSDGTAAGTRIVKDITPGSTGSEPRNMVVVGSEVYFLAANGLYRTDAAATDATLVATGIGAFTPARAMAVVGEWLYFVASNGTGTSGLWRVRAGAAAEQVVALGGIEGVYNVNGRLILQARTRVSAAPVDDRIALYESDGTAAGTRQVVDLGTSQYVPGPLYATPFGAVFSHAGGVYATDFTNAGTRRIAVNQQATGAVIYRGQPYVQLRSAWDTIQPGDGLYVTDGTAAGTRLVKAGRFYLQDAFADGRMFFPGFEPGGKFSLYESDGTEGGTRVASGVAPSAYNFDYQRMVTLDRTLLFIGNDFGEHGEEVWRVNPDVVAPAVAGIEFRRDVAGGPAVRVRFSERVAASLTAASLVLTDLATGRTFTPANARLDYDSATDTATFTFPGGLPDGNYRASIAPAAASDPSGNALASGASVDFSMLAGDANGDRVVNFDDLLALAQNYNKVGATYAQGDFNSDGVVNFDDLLIIAKAYNKVLELPPPPPAPAPWVTAPVSASMLPSSPSRKDQTAKAVFSTTPVAKPAPAKAKPAAKPARRV